MADSGIGNSAEMNTKKDEMGRNKRYVPGEVEAKWQAIWESEKAFVAGNRHGADKYYVLEMFPYPSGKIHMGHVRNYSIGDVVARFKQMKGFDVLHPMGWDSFGLPAENAAIERGVHPAEWTRDNIDNMRIQLKRIGLGYDWNREIATCMPDYYRWSQWIFLKLFKKGLAYKKRSSVNWCAKCVTVLANEQVEDGLCWRCESVVEPRELEQWFFKTTAYAEELLDSTYGLKGWPEKVLVMQRNWIGKSVGADVDFTLKGSGEKITVFTTRPDTLYGVTFMSLAPDHPLVDKIVTEDKRDDIAAFRAEVEAGNVAAAKSNIPGAADEVEKKGVFTGAYCTNPLNGESVPVYVANFVLMGYGTGAVMAVPAHDSRDFEFAKKYGLNIKVVIEPEGETLDAKEMKEAYTADGIMTGSFEFNGMKSTDAKAAIVKLLTERKAGIGATNYKLRDWGISRQRYWGCPIPIIYCDDCGTLPVPDSALPVLLPEDVKFEGATLSPLESSDTFVNTTCPKCGKEAQRETDTMDTFVDSSWYFLRYVSATNTDIPFDSAEVSRWLPVDRYIGGVEHAVMHLLYARFFTKALRDMGLLAIDEPFKNLLTQGMVCKETERCPTHGYLLPEEVDNAKCRACGEEAVTGSVEKMSKSKKNVIDPDAIIERYGADTTRLFSLFAAPPEKDLDWSVEGVEGSFRFLSRVWRLVTENASLLDGGTSLYSKQTDGPLDKHPELKAIHQTTHKTIKKVTHDIEDRFHFNTAISAVMELVNALYLFIRNKNVETDDPLTRKVFKESVLAVVQLISPFAPHMAEELWQGLNADGVPLYRTQWPSYDEEALIVDTVTIVVQINGKVRARLSVAADSTEQSVTEAAMAEAKVAEWLDGKVIRKKIYIPNRILNLVAR